MPFPRKKKVAVPEDVPQRLPISGRITRKPGAKKLADPAPGAHAQKGKFGVAGHTEEEWDKLLEYIEKTLNKAGSCKAACISATSFYGRLREDPEFAKRFEEAWSRGYDRMEEIARQRAFAGFEKPVFYKGEIVGHITEYSDTLAMFLLKANNPNKFVDRSEVYTNNLNKNVGFDASRLTDEQLEELVQQKSAVASASALPKPILVKKKTE